MELNDAEATKSVFNMQHEMQFYVKSYVLRKTQE